MSRRILSKTAVHSQLLCIHTSKREHLQEGIDCNFSTAFLTPSMILSPPLLRVDSLTLLSSLLLWLGKARVSTKPKQASKQPQRHVKPKHGHEEKQTNQKFVAPSTDGLIETKHLMDIVSLCLKSRVQGTCGFGSQRCVAKLRGRENDQRP